MGRAGSCRDLNEIHACYFHEQRPISLHPLMVPRPGDNALNLDEFKMLLSSSDLQAKFSLSL